jgi:hypothetical protein
VSTSTADGGIPLADDVAIGLELPAITDEHMKGRLPQSQDYTLLILKRTPKLKRPELEPIIREHGRRNMALRQAGLMPIVCPVRENGANMPASASSPSPLIAPQELLDQGKATIFGPVSSPSGTWVSASSKPRPSMRCTTSVLPIRPSPRGCAPTRWERCPRPPSRSSANLAPADRAPPRRAPRPAWRRQSHW